MTIPTATEKGIEKALDVTHGAMRSLARALAEIDTGKGQGDCGGGMAIAALQRRGLADHRRRITRTGLETIRQARAWGW